MRHRTNGHMVQRGLGWIIAALLGTVLASCGAMADDDHARPEGDALSSESVSEEEMGVPEIAEDGRMLQPRGHEGLWFETEPADPWERYVWLSQKYVGDPVHLGQLAEGEVSEGFVGEPDICSEEVIARMGEIGFRNTEGVKTDSMLTCSFSTDFVGVGSQSGFVDLLMFAGENRKVLIPHEIELMDQEKRTAYELSGVEGEFQCAGRLSADTDRVQRLVSGASASAKQDFDQYCYKSLLGLEIFKNIGL